MAWLHVIWYCGERLFLFYPGNEYFNPHSKGWFEFCNCRECFDFGDFWCGFLVSVEENSGYTEINARLSLAQELGIHCWTECCCCSNSVLKSSGKTGACLSSYCHYSGTWREGCERPFVVLDGYCGHWALLNFPQSHWLLFWNCHLGLLHSMLVWLDCEIAYLSKSAFDKVCLCIFN